MTSSETTFNDAELIESLRLWNRDDAADRIEALTKERDDYAQKLMQANNTYTEMHLEIERLSDKLAKAVKLIDMAVELARWDLNPKLRDDMIDFTTEIKGERHE